MLPAIDRGFFQQEISDASYRYQRETDEHRRTIVGVNGYTDDAPLKIPILAMNAQGYERQVGRLNRLRESRDNGAVGQALDRLRIACNGTENTMPHILRAVHVYATLGELTDVMRGCFGVYHEPTWI